MIIYQILQNKKYHEYFYSIMYGKIIDDYIVLNDGLKIPKKYIDSNKSYYNKFYFTNKIKANLKYKTLTAI